MKLKLLDKLIMLSKLSIYGLVIQCILFSSILAEDISAQKIKSVNDVSVELNINKARLEKVFKYLEDKTDFYFSYSKEDIDKSIDYSFKKGERTILGDVLMELSEKSGLKFRQVNRNIIVQKKDGNLINNVPVEIMADVDISGKITDENGQGLPGASVVEKGTANGVTTDLDGNYKLSLPDDASITISFVGYTTQEILVGAQSTIDVQMELDTEQLEEIVVIGYGTAKLKNITGSVVQVDLEDSPVGLLPGTNVLQSLRGGVAGVNIGNQNIAGRAPSILVRGQNSINGSNDPLIVLDGVIYLGSIADINPSDIANISVLKDASAAAAYGSRSANGVIMINSKKGKSNKPTIRFSTSTGVNTWTDKTKLLETPEYLEKYAIQNNFPTTGDIVWDDETRTVLVDQGVNTDWLDLVTRSGAIQDHQVSVSGNTDKIDYFFSGGYSSQEGVIVGDDFDRISTRMRLNVDVTSWLDVSLDGAYNQNDWSGRAANFQRANNIGPMGYPYRYDGMPFNTSSNTGTDLERWPTGGSLQNPLWGTDGTVENIDKDNFFRLTSSLLFTVPKIDGLTYRLNYSINANFRTQNEFFYENYFIQEQNAAPYFDRYSDASLRSNLSQAEGTNINMRDYNYVVDNIINYNKEFGDHYIDATLVATRDFKSQKRTTWTGRDFAANGNTSLGVNGLAFASVQTNSVGIVERSNIGYLARIGYTFNPELSIRKCSNDGH